MGNRQGRQRRGKGNTGLHGCFAWAIASLVMAEKKKKDAMALAGGLTPGGEKGEAQVVRDATNTIISLADPPDGRMAGWPILRLRRGTASPANLPA